MAEEVTVEKTPRPKSAKPALVSQPNGVVKPAGFGNNRKRIGRGEGSGTGKTSGRGQKGQRSRSGSTKKPGFEGGQLPIHRRVPKRGFTNIHRINYEPVNLYYLEKAGLTGEVTPEILAQKGIISNKKARYKILGQGEIKSALNVIADKFSKSAVQKIEGAGGKAEIRQYAKAQAQA